MALCTYFHHAVIFPPLGTSPETCTFSTSLAAFLTPRVTPAPAPPRTSCQRTCTHSTAPSRPTHAKTKRMTCRTLPSRPFHSFSFYRSVPPHPFEQTRERLTKLHHARRKAARMGAHIHPM